MQPGASPGDYTFYKPSACGVLTEQFSASYRLQEIFVPGNYLFTVGGDDGYRLSIDGGSTWVNDNWGAHGYTTSTYNASMSGSYNMFLEYYEKS